MGAPYLNDYVKPEDTNKCVKFPLRLAFCTNCGLGQLREQAPQDWSFRQYWYRSGITQTMKSHLAEIVATASEMVELFACDSVLDIGANDGTLLRCYPKFVNRMGFEPAINLTEQAREGGNDIVPSYFSAGVLETKFKIITSISMFYDVPNPLQFLQDVKKLLSNDGVFICQMNYAGSMFEQNAFDNIGHEHVGYYTLNTLVTLMFEAGLIPFRVEKNDINGGSIRVYAKKKVPVLQASRNPKIMADGSVSGLIAQEMANGLTTLDKWLTLEDNIIDICYAVQKQIDHWREQKKKIFLLGASTRSSTFMQYFELDRGVITGASERDERKFGLVTSGTWIPIYSEEYARAEADCFIIGPWAFKKELLEREHEFLARGGEMLFPMPVPIKVTAQGEFEL